MHFRDVEGCRNRKRCAHFELVWILSVVRLLVYIMGECERSVSDMTFDSVLDSDPECDLS